MNKNSCYTYFAIYGNFEPEEITKALNLQPFKTLKAKGENSACWEYGKCEEFDIFAFNQVSKTIKDLIPKKEILKKLKQELNLEFYICIVPTMYVNEIAQVLSPSKETIDFCYETGTEIDIDLYLLN